MPQERRASQRRAISRYAKVQVNGALPRDCLVNNVSEGGLRLHVEGLDVPDDFTVLLDEGSGAKPRRCRVMWRLGYEVGVKFIDRFGPDYVAGDMKRAKEPA
jgi:hypothetical protein